MQSVTCPPLIPSFQTLEEVVVSLAARGGVSAGVFEALSRRLAASEMCDPNFHVFFMVVWLSCVRRERRANMTVVDVLTQRLENEQENCKRQSEAINNLRIELAAYQGTQVFARSSPCLPVLCPDFSPVALSPKSRCSRRAFWSSCLSADRACCCCQVRLCDS
jgi:hypothetical protein